MGKAIWGRKMTLCVIATIININFLQKHYDKYTNFSNYVVINFKVQTNTREERKFARKKS